MGGSLHAFIFPLVLGRILKVFYCICVSLILEGN